jgi:hypothetical protein
MLCLTIVWPIEVCYSQELKILEETTFENSISNHDFIDLYQTYMPDDLNEKIDYNCDVNLPWYKASTDLLEWWIVIEYNGKTFEKLVPVSIYDFKEKFLKHPEYGESIRFNIDYDVEDDIEIIAGFYWSIIKDIKGNDVESLEKRIRFRQLETGDYIEHSDASITVWSELHINYGLFEKKAKNRQGNTPYQFSFQEMKNLFNLKMYKKYYQNLSEKNPFILLIETIYDKILYRKTNYLTDYKNPVTLVNENDYISVGIGYRSLEGEVIPRYVEKRFSFGRDELFSPTIFQHIVDPGSSKGQSIFELLYGFKSYKSETTDPFYDIEFSKVINPAVYLKTKFTPANGCIYSYFEESSQTNNPTSITFTSNVIKGVGEDVELTFTLDSIDDTLGKSGRWMSFDIDLFGDNELLGGNIHYKASHKFTIGVLINSPFFEEKIELCEIPKYVDISWDLDFVLIPKTLFFAHAEGFLDISMSSSIGSINLYYPKTDSSYEDKIFITIPKGLPMNTKVETAVTLNIDLTNLQNNENYIYGEIKHDCSHTIDDIQVFLPDEDLPLIKVTDIPATSEILGKLYWSNLQGYAYTWRGSDSTTLDPVELNLEYKGYRIYDILTIRNGYINTKFRVADEGYFFFDTSEGIFGNNLEVTNIDTGDSLILFVDEVSADNLQAEWDIDTSGETLRIKNIGFNGMIDTMKGLGLSIDYKGKVASLQLDWILGQTGFFQIQVNQEEDLSIDFSEFALNSTVFQIDGGITLSDLISFDMEWQLKQGKEGDSGNVDPGFFSINKYNDQSMIKEFNFYMTYQNQYGVNIEFDNLRLFLDFEWWKGDRLLPYIWLDYEVNVEDFDIDLLWTNAEGMTQWYQNVEDW